MLQDNFWLYTITHDGSVCMPYIIWCAIYHEYSPVLFASIYHPTGSVMGNSIESCQSILNIEFTHDWIEWYVDIHPCLFKTFVKDTEHWIQYWIRYWLNWLILPHSPMRMSECFMNTSPIDCNCCVPSLNLWLTNPMSPDVIDKEYWKHWWSHCLSLLVASALDSTPKE